jgi:hypothetical protein
MKEATAWERLERSIKMLKELGVQPKLARMPDGRLGIALGDGLIEELPSDLTLPAARPQIPARTPNRDE